MSKPVAYDALANGDRLRQTDASVEFDRSIYADERGDVVTLAVDMTNVDTATVQIGQVDNNGYAIVTEISDDDADGFASVEFNSFTAGDESSTTITAGDEGTSIDAVRHPSDSFDGNANPTGSDIIEATDYSLYAASGSTTGTIDGQADARGTLSLRDPSVEELQMWTAPQSSLSELQDGDVADIFAAVRADTLTQTDTVANGDTIVVQVQASGLEGALENGGTTELYGDTSDARSLFSLTFDGPSVPNSPDESANIADLSPADYSVLYDGTNDAHYVVINSTALVEAGTLSHQSGDEYTANFTVYDDVSDLVEDDTSVTQAFSVEEPDVELDTNADNEVVLEAASSQEITGETNLAPGSDVEVSLTSDTSTDPFVKRPEATVQTDGSFTALADFSNNEAGTEFTAQAFIDDSPSPETDGRLIEEAVTPATDTPEYTETPDYTTPEYTETPDYTTPTYTETPDYTTPVYTETPDYTTEEYNPPERDTMTPDYTTEEYNPPERDTVTPVVIDTPVYTTAYDSSDDAGSSYFGGVFETDSPTTEADEQEEDEDDDDAADDEDDDDGLIGASGPGFGAGVTVVALLALVLIALPRLE